MRCAECGATNPDTADWCGQCYGPLVPATSPPPAATAPPVATSEPGDPTTEGFRRRGELVEWECPGCGQWQGVDALRCVACGTSIEARWQAAVGDPKVIERRFAEPWTVILALSALVPGAGHIGVGRFGTGAARAVLYGVWLAGGVALWRAGGALAGGPLVLGAGVLWAGTIGDVLALRAGSRELLGGRSLLWLVVGVLGLSFVGLFAAAAGGPAAGPVGVG